MGSVCDTLGKYVRGSWKSGGGANSKLQTVGSGGGEGTEYLQ